MGKPMDRSGRFLSPSFDSFEKAFPALQAAFIEYYETGDGVTTDPMDPFSLNAAPRQYGQPTRVTSQHARMRCSNQLCRNGGYAIDGEISRMVHQKKEREEFVLHCLGYVIPPRRGMGGKTCPNMLHVRLTLKYKNPAQGKP